jgi:hypothetical protein
MTKPRIPLSLPMVGSREAAIDSFTPFLQEVLVVMLGFLKLKLY